MAAYFRRGKEEGWPSSELPEVIPEGGRETFMVSLAGSMRKRGASERAILAALQVENEDRCWPPLDFEDLERIAGSVSRYEPQTAPAADALLERLRKRKGAPRSLTEES